MLEVTFYRDSRKRLSSIVAHGHARSGTFGKDIVCAAVSAILQAARLGLEEHARVNLDVTQRTGEMRLQWPQTARDDVAVCAIAATAELSVKQIAREHPAHVRVHRRLLRPQRPGVEP